MLQIKHWVNMLAVSDIIKTISATINICMRSLSAESRHRMGAGRRGKSVSQETRELLRQSRLGKRHSAETRAKIRASVIASPAAQAALARAQAARTGITMTEEHRRKLSQARLAYLARIARVEIDEAARAERVAIGDAARAAAALANSGDGYVDERALAKLVEMHQQGHDVSDYLVPLIDRILSGLLIGKHDQYYGDDDDRDDYRQEACLHLLKQLKDSYNPAKGRVFTFISLVGGNKMRDIARSARRHSSRINNLLSDATSDHTIARRVMAI